jgi:hypothetical protein
MYVFHYEETRRLVSIFKKYWRYVSIFKYIDAMLLNLDPDIVRSGPRLHSICSKQHGGSASSSADDKKFFLIYQYSKISKNFKILKLKKKHFLKFKISKINFFFKISKFSKNFKNFSFHKISKFWYLNNNIAKHM